MRYAESAPTRGLFGNVERHSGWHDETAEAAPHWQASGVILMVDFESDFPGSRVPLAWHDFDTATRRRRAASRPTGMCPPAVRL